MMKRFSLVLCALACLLALGGTGVASAQIVELGRTASPLVAPACPKGGALASCRIVLVHTTAIQTTSDGVTSPTLVKKAGWVVSFTVGLSNLVSKASTERQILHGLDKSWGGPPQLALTVLRPTGRNTYQVVAQSDTYHVMPFLGQVIQEPLSLPPTFSTFTALPVRAGDVIGLTVPTWAPVLAYDLSSSRFAYRQSRRENCNNTPGTQTAQTAVGSRTQYGCSYPGARIEYSATEVVDQPYPKTYVH
jgi:hypothetical protein